MEKQRKNKRIPKVTSFLRTSLKVPLKKKKVKNLYFQFLENFFHFINPDLAPRDSASRLSRILSDAKRVHAVRP